MHGATFYFSLAYLLSLSSVVPIFSDFCLSQRFLSLLGFPKARSHWDYCKKLDLTIKWKIPMKRLLSPLAGL